MILLEKYCDVVESQAVRAALRAFLRPNETPAQFADRTGLSPATIYRLMAIDSEISPSIDTISAIVSADGLTLSAFFAQLEGESAQPHSGSNRAQPPANATHQVPERITGDSGTREGMLLAAATITEALTAVINKGFDRLLNAQEQAATARPVQTKRHANR